MKHKDIQQFVIAIFPSGSRVICNPPPTDTDEDFVVLCKPSVCAFDILEHLEGLGYTTSSGKDEYADMGDFDNHEGFMSFKKGEINYILTQSVEMYEGFMLATVEATEKNLLDKGERIKVFRKHLYGEEI